MLQGIIRASYDAMIERRAPRMLFGRVGDAKDEIMKMTRIIGLFLLSASVLLMGTPVAAQSQGRRGTNQQRVKKYDPAVLVVVANFGKAKVTVNGLAYPEYAGESEEPGMVLPAGGPYRVEVSFDGNLKTYSIYLKAYETRYLMVDLTGFNGTKAVAAAPRPTAAPTPPPKADEGNNEMGRVTVYSKPGGKILVDGKDSGEASPGTVEVEPGRHEVAVRFDSGNDSERKVVRVRKGSRIKLFFREKEGE